MKLLSICISDIADAFVEEAEIADIAADMAYRTRMKKYSALVAVASVGVAVAFSVIRAKRGGKIKAIA